MCCKKRRRQFIWYHLACTCVLIVRFGLLHHALLIRYRKRPAISLKPEQLQYVVVELIRVHRLGCGFQELSRWVRMLRLVDGDRPHEGEVHGQVGGVPQERLTGSRSSPEGSLGDTAAALLHGGHRDGGRPTGSSGGHVRLCSFIPGVCGVMRTLMMR